MSGGGPWGLAGKGQLPQQLLGALFPWELTGRGAALLGRMWVFLGPPKGRMSLKSYIILDYADEQLTGSL